MVEPEFVLRDGELKNAVECLLFVASEPLSSKDLAEALEMEQGTIQEAIDELIHSLEERSGLQVVKVAGGYQLCTRPEYAEYCAKLLHPGNQRLSRAALETLAVVAYRQPVTVPEIEAVRGVAAGGVVRTLLDRGLIKEAGRKPTVGRPILYCTTEEFLQHFGLSDISELPDVESLGLEEIRNLEAQRSLFENQEVIASVEEEPSTAEV